MVTALSMLEKRSWEIRERKFQCINYEGEVILMFRWDFNVACRISSSIISVDRLSGKKWKWWSHWYGLTVYMLSVLDAQDIAVGIVMYANLLDTVAATATTSFMFSTIVRDHTACSWTSSWLVQWPLSEAQASTPYTFTTYMAPFEGLERWVKKLQLVSYMYHMCKFGWSYSIQALDMAVRVILPRELEASNEHLP